MTIFDEFRDTATGLLMELAVPVTLRKVSRTYDPDTRETTQTMANHAGRGVLTPPPGSITQGARAVDAVQVVAQYAVIGSLPAGIAPAVDDLFLIGARSFRINGATPVQPDGTPILWRLALGDS